MGPGTKIRLPPAAWASAIRWTAIVTAVSVMVSLGATEVILDTLSHGVSVPGYVAAIAMPILLGGPTMLYLTVNQQRLKHLNQQLHLLASTDWLTSCLNHRAFTSQVSARLKPPADSAAAPTGALLIIDADHFKAINDRFGHERGDEALQMMAAAMQASVRAGDLVGRLGGEEFGVFLQGADNTTAAIVAERIRQSISALAFAPGGSPHPLSVSVGGVMFGGAVGFSELFRIADERLYRVKHSGRNRVDLAEIAASSTSSQAA
ncbi:MAG: GGDEF domain-containing protein [Devosia sp.]|nr:GGDEF domain-containing protein [Devosia sp.]